MDGDHPFEIIELDETSRVPDAVKGEAGLSIVVAKVTINRGDYLFLGSY